LSTRNAAPPTGSSATSTAVRIVTHVGAMPAHRAAYVAAAANPGEQDELGAVRDVNRVEEGLRSGRAVTGGAAYGSDREANQSEQGLDRRGDGDLRPSPPPAGSPPRSRTKPASSTSTPARRGAARCAGERVEAGAQPGDGLLAEHAADPAPAVALSPWSTSHPPVSLDRAVFPIGQLACVEDIADARAQPGQLTRVEPGGPPQQRAPRPPTRSPTTVAAGRSPTARRTRCVNPTGPPDSPATRFRLRQHDQEGGVHDDRHVRRGRLASSARPPPGARPA
jgi:hypothetical protein